MYIPVITIDEQLLTVSYKHIKDDEPETLQIPKISITCYDELINLRYINGIHVGKVPLGATLKDITIRKVNEE